MGPINEIMTVLHTTKKGKFMDTPEKFHIYKETRNSNQINEKTRLSRTPYSILPVPMISHRTHIVQLSSKCQATHSQSLQPATHTPSNTTT